MAPDGYAKGAHVHVLFFRQDPFQLHSIMTVWQGLLRPASYLNKYLPVGMQELNFLLLLPPILASLHEWLQQTCPFQTL